MTIKICEVGPRDGLQNIEHFVETQNKVRLIELLSLTGLSYIELSSFVSPKAIPQLSDAKQVVEKTRAYVNAIQTSVLVPNMRGLEKALESGMKEVSIFTAASETFNQKNIQASIEESFVRFEPVCKEALSNGLKVRAYVSTAFVCPFEGEIKAKNVLPIMQRLFDLGCYEVSIGDTIGKARTEQIKSLYGETEKLSFNSKLAGHYHDTYGRALSHVKTSLDFGITTFDSSVAGIGGCPYAPGASGNLATETLVQWCHENDHNTGVDLKKLHAAGQFIQEQALE